MYTMRIWPGTKSQWQNKLYTSSYKRRSSRIPWAGKNPVVSTVTNISGEPTKNAPGVIPKNSIKSRDIRKIEVRENVDIYPIIPYILTMKGKIMKKLLKKIYPFPGVIQLGPIMIDWMKKGTASSITVKKKGIYIIY